MANDTVFRCMAINDADGTLKQRIVTSEAKAIETCERWGRVPIFTRVGYVQSKPIQWDEIRTKVTTAR